MSNLTRLGQVGSGPTPLPREQRTLARAHVSDTTHTLHVALLRCTPARTSHPFLGGWLIAHGSSDETPTGRGTAPCNTFTHIALLARWPMRRGHATPRHAAPRQVFTQSGGRRTHQASLMSFHEFMCSALTSYLLADQLSEHLVAAAARRPRAPSASLRSIACWHVSSSLVELGRDAAELQTELRHASSDREYGSHRYCALLAGST